MRHRIAFVLYWIFMAFWIIALATSVRGPLLYCGSSIWILLFVWLMYETEKETKKYLKAKDNIIKQIGIDTIRKATEKKNV